MKRCFLPVVVTAFCICVALAFPRQSVSQGPAVAYQIKAAYLFNFAKFVEWPRMVFPRPDTPFTFCIAGDPFQGALDRTLQAETINNRPLVVRQIGRMENLTGCHILYIGPSESRRAAELLAATGMSPILTVGESAEFINEGGIVRFIETGNRIRFQINPDAAERVSLRMSSRLLRLADIARPRQRAGNQ